MEGDGCFYDIAGARRPSEAHPDLHDIYNRGQDIDRALRAVKDEAVAKKAPLVEIIPARRLTNPVTRCWAHPNYGYAGTDDRRGTGPKA